MPWKKGSGSILHILGTLAPLIPVRKKSSSQMDSRQNHSKSTLTNWGAYDIYDVKNLI